MDNDGNKTVSKFTYASANKTGHKISFPKPILFQLEEVSKFQKVLSLISVFENLDICNKDYVVLHFDTVNDRIPSNLQFIFEYHFGIHENVTNNYQDFALSNSSILVCSYLTFRGLEHSEITVIVYRDIYFLQPYLAESLTRCTSKLTVVLQNSTTLTKITEEWKKSQLVDQWKVICSKDLQRNDFNIKKRKDDSEHYGKMEERFNDLLNNEDEVKESKMKSFAKNPLF